MLKRIKEYKDIHIQEGLYGRVWHDLEYKPFYWCNLCRNPNAIHIIEKNLWRLDGEDEQYEEFNKCWSNLSANPNAIHLLEDNLDKVDWTNLSRNRNAIHILVKNPLKIDWNILAENTNPNAIPLLEKNLNKLNELGWKNLFANPNAIPFLEKNLEKIMEKVDWKALSANPNAINLLEKNMKNVNWSSLSANPNAIHLLENNMDKVDWEMFCLNPNAIPIVERNMLHLVESKMITFDDGFSCPYKKYKLPWFSLCKNPNALHILEQDILLYSISNPNPTVELDCLSENPNPNVISFIIKYFDYYSFVLDDRNPHSPELWGNILANPYLFVPDEYKIACRDYFKQYVTEEFTRFMFHPDNMKMFHGWGFEEEIIE